MDGITDSMDMSLSRLREMVRTGKPGMPQAMECSPLLKESDMIE